VEVTKPRRRLIRADPDDAVAHLICWPVSARLCATIERAPRARKGVCRCPTARLQPRTGCLKKNRPPAGQGANTWTDSAAHQRGCGTCDASQQRCAGYHNPKKGVMSTWAESAKSL